MIELSHWLLDLERGGKGNLEVRRFFILNEYWLLYFKVY